MLKLLRRNAAFIYFSFIITGLTTVGPQRLFAGVTHGEAEAWVAGTLLVGTVASLAAVRLADRYRLPGSPAWCAAALIFMMTAALLGSFAASALLLAASLQVVTRFLANYTKQEFDHRGVMLAGSDDRIQNDRVAVMMRFIGMVFGPLWFGAFQISSAAMLGTLFVMAVLSLASVSGLMETAKTEWPVPQRVTALNAHDRLLIAVAIGIYAQYYLLAANIVYILNRFYDVSQSSAWAGVTITTVYATAMVVTVVTLRSGWQNFGLLCMLPAPVLMLICGALLNSSVTAMRTVTFAASVALGFAYAAYLLAVRNHVTGHMQNSHGLAFFNNLANTSALAGFSVMTVLVAMSRMLNWNYAALLAVGLCTLSVATIAGAVGCGLNPVFLRNHRAELAQSISENPFGRG